MNVLESASFSFGDLKSEDAQAILEIERFFEQPNKDLQLLMDQYFPSAKYKGLKTEYDTAALAKQAQTSIIMNGQPAALGAEQANGAAVDTASQVKASEFENNLGPLSADAEVPTGEEEDLSKFADLNGHATGEVVGGFLALGTASE